VISINLYRPGRFNYYIQFPTEWNELLPSEAIEISRQMLLNATNQQVARAAVLHYIINHRAKLQGMKLPAGWIDLMDAEQAVINGYPLLDFIYNENTLTQAPENHIRLPGFLPLTVHGPGNFENITCGEYEDTEIFFNQFYEEPGEKPLAGIAAVLWRPKGELYLSFKAENSTWIHYNTNRIIHRFLKLAPWRLYAIFTWYTGCRNQLPKLFATVYEKHSDSSDQPDMLAFTKCIHAASGPKNGTRDQIRILKLYELMFDMEQEAIKAKELKEYYEQQRNQVH